VLEADVNAGAAGHEVVVLQKALPAMDPFAAAAEVEVSTKKKVVL
jgi:hypothetical protein